MNNVLPASSVAHKFYSFITDKWQNEDVGEFAQATFFARNLPFTTPS
jgi:hypothetical protein